MAPIKHAISTRHGGVSAAPFDTLNLGFATADTEDHVAVNRRRLFASLDVLPRDVIGARLTHGKEVSVFRRSRPREFPVAALPVRDGSARVERAFLTDGVVSDVPGLHFFLTFADCVPLVFFDAATGALGAAHAGWRGTAAGVGAEVVRTMSEVFGSDPGDIRVGIGPSIGPCCYTVGEAVFDTFRQRGNEAVTGKDRSHLDLWTSNEHQLRRVGVSDIESARICTACNTHTFFSHRGEAGRTGRFGLCVGLP